MRKPSLDREGVDEVDGWDDKWFPALVLEKLFLL